ncbi:MAG: T9SS type A sorting domain-containing protein [bacterium]|nr:T9SS type A sorting domain-containing protein [bacterium]
MRLGIFCLVMALCMAGEVAAYEFTDLTTIPQRNIRDFAPSSDRTLVLTDDELVLVDWSRPDGERDSVLVAGFHDGRGLHRSGAAQVALAPVGQGGHAVVVPHDDGTWSVDFVDDPEWLPPQVWLGGRPWFIDEREREGYLLPALGREGEAIHVASPDIPNPDMFAMDRDRAVAGLESGYGPDEVGFYQVGDLSDPEHPVWGPVIEVPFRFGAAEMVGRTLCLGTNRFECWDVTDVQAPVFRGVTGGAKFFVGMEHTGDGLVGCWSNLGNYYMLIVDVDDPVDPVVVADSYIGPAYYGQPFCLSDNELVVREGAGLRRMYSPDGSIVVHAAENAWPVIESGSVMAMDGRHVWIQAEGRLLADLATGSLETVPTPSAPAVNWGYSVPRRMHLHRGHLFRLPGNGRLQVEDVSDPARAVTVAEIRPPGEAILSMKCLGDRMLLRTRTRADVYDVSDPATPTLLHSEPLTSPRDGVSILPNCLAILVASDDYHGFMRVLVPDDEGRYSEVVRRRSGYWTYAIPYAMGTDLFVQLAETQWDHTEYWDWIRYDLSDPSSPVPADSGSDGGAPGGAWSTMRLGAEVGFLTSNYFYSRDVHRWSLSGGDLFNRESPAWAILELAGRPIAAGAFRNRAVVLHTGSVSTFTVTDETSNVVPPAGGGSDVFAVPNPLNPMTEIVFDMPSPGSATVEIFDVRGRRVLERRDSWPQGSNRLPWTGLDDRGRALASGVYLLRVTTPASTVHGRCTIVR